MGKVIRLKIPKDMTRKGWTERIAASWQASVAAFIETGQLLLAARATMDHGEFLPMIEKDLPFGERTAERLMKIAADQRLSNPTHVSDLPPSWGTLYELTKLSDGAFKRGIAKGIIRPDMERKDIKLIERPGGRWVAKDDKPLRKLKPEGEPTKPEYEKDMKSFGREFELMIKDFKERFLGWYLEHMDNWIAENVEQAFSETWNLNLLVYTEIQNLRGSFSEVANQIQKHRDKNLGGPHGLTIEEWPGFDTLPKPKKTPKLTTKPRRKETKP